MKTTLRNVDDHGVKYTSLMFVCPGCVAGGPEGYQGIHLLPVNCSDVKNPSWEFNGDLEKPTLSPSILTKGGYVEVCHSFLTDGVFEFLTDSTHPLAGQKVPIPDLPVWATE